MKRIILLLLILNSCEPPSHQDPFIIDQSEIANIRAFKEASMQITSDWASYSKGSKDWPDIYRYLSTKKMKLNRFNEFYLDSREDSSIWFSDKGYILIGDTVFKHSIIYNRKGRREINPTSENRMLVKKIDTNLYYIIYIESCLGC